MRSTGTLLDTAAYAINLRDTGGAKELQTGTIPSNGIVHLIILRTLPNFLISPANCSISLLGKQLVQNPS